MSKDYRMQIVVTGGSGFVGRHLIQALENQSINVTNIDSELGYDIASWDSISEISQFDILVHLAAMSYVPDSYKKPLNYYNTIILY